MNVGMLWFCNPQKSLAENVASAAAHYEKKYGRMPTLCLANPSALDKGPADGKAEACEAVITVRPYRPVLPGHLWIGVEDEIYVQEEKPS